MNSQDWINKLGLIEHIEGGHYSETYRSIEEIPTSRTGGVRSVMTSIYYMLTAKRPINYLHKNKSDIVHYFQAGSPITYLLIDPQGQLHHHMLGLGDSAAELPQLLVPGGYWKAAVLEQGEYGLIGEAVAPGFDFRDMTIATSDQIRKEFPALWQEISIYIKATQPDQQAMD